MRRRGFLGFLAGAAAAGPGMVKEAAAQTMADLSLGGVGHALGSGFGSPVSGPRDDKSWAFSNLARLVGRTTEQHAWHRAGTSVHSLDPDIGSYRSVALWHKINTQRGRNYDRGLKSERTYLEATIAGWLD